MKKYCLLLLLLFSLNSYAVSEWIIIPTESKLTFTATQNGAPVEGEFTTFTGTIFFDRNDMKDNKVNIEIDMKSLKTSYADLTQTLKTAEWLNIITFPSAKFTANQFQKVTNNQYIANGNLTVKDKTIPIKLNFTEETTSNPDKVKVSGNTILKRTAFSVGQGEWASTKEVKDEVAINFVVTATRKK